MEKQPLLPKTEQSPNRTVWYLAYGSNLSAKTFVQDRHITPQAAIAVRVPGWILSMSSAGFPYREPAMASIRIIPALKPPGEKLRLSEDQTLMGTAYLISRSQWIQIIASEGGGIAYEEAVVDAYPLAPEHQKQWGARIRAMTLVSTMERLHEAHPSARYLGLIIDGAQAGGLPQPYVTYLRERFSAYVPRTTLWARLGAALFLAFWTPIISLLSILTHVTTRTKPNEDGHVPVGVRVLVRMAMFTMWFVHDAGWANIWGRGDGREEIFERQFALVTSQPSVT